MLALLINCGTVIIGSIAGILVGKKLSENFKVIVFTCSGLVTLIMGIQMAVKSTNLLVMLISLLLGGFIGFALKIEDRVYQFGEFLSKRTGSNDSKGFATGFMTASVLFCTGAMSVVGSIQVGTTGEMQTILIKSVMDGCMAVVFAAVYGIGVMFSFITIFLYQGFFTLAGGWIEPLLGELGIAELAATGGALLMMIGLGLLKIKEFKTANFLPALIFAPVLANLAAKIF